MRHVRGCSYSNAVGKKNFISIFRLLWRRFFIKKKKNRFELICLRLTVNAMSRSYINVLHQRYACDNVTDFFFRKKKDYNLI